MIDINKVKSRLLSLAFRGLLFDYPVKKKQNDGGEKRGLKKQKTNKVSVFVVAWLVDLR